MRSAAKKPEPEPEPEPTLAQVRALMKQNSGDVAATRRLTQQALACCTGDPNPLILLEARLGVLGDSIDRLAMAVARAALAPGRASGPVGVPGPSTVPSQRTAPRHPLMTVVRP